MQPATVQFATLHLGAVQRAHLLPNLLPKFVLRATARTGAQSWRVGTRHAVLDADPPDGDRPRPCMTSVTERPPWRSRQAWT